MNNYKKEELSCQISSYEIKDNIIIITLGNNKKISLNYDYNIVVEIEKRIARQENKYLKKTNRY